MGTSFKSYQINKCSLFDRLSSSHGQLHLASHVALNSGSSECEKHEETINMQVLELKQHLTGIRTRSRLADKSSWKHETRSMKAAANDPSGH